MLRRTLTAAVIAMFLVASGVQAQEYKIKVKEYPDKGKKATVIDTIKTVQSVKVSIGGQVVKEDTKKQTKQIEYTSQVLEMGKARPKKYQHAYNKAVMLTNGAKRSLSYDDRTIIYELKNGKYEATAKGEPAIPEKDLKELEKTANQSLNSSMTSVLLPKKAVKVGETWKVDPKKVASTMAKDFPLVLEKSSVTGKLAKVYKKGNSQFGVIDVRIKLAVPKLGPIPLQKPVFFDVTISLDTAIDGSSTAGVLHGRGGMKGQTTIMQGNQNLGIDFNFSLDNVQKSSAEK